MFRLAVCRYKLSSISTAIALFGEALTLAERSGMPCDLLRSELLAWRSRCYRRQRDWEAAREDVERALELAEGLDDKQALGHVYFQASLIAERNGQWVLARTYAERAKTQYEELSDRANVGRLLNNLGGLNFLLGKPDEAKRYLKDAFGVALEVGHDDDAAQAVSSLAQVHLRTGELELAEEQARHALELLTAARTSSCCEIGNAQLVLGRSLLERGRLDEAEAAFADAEQTFAAVESPSHRAAAWVAQGDLAAEAKRRPVGRSPVPSRGRDSAGLPLLKPNQREEVRMTMTSMLVRRFSLLAVSGHARRSPRCARGLCRFAELRLLRRTSPGRL